MRLIASEMAPEAPRVQTPWRNWQKGKFKKSGAKQREDEVSKSEPYAARFRLVPEDDELVMYVEIKETRRGRFKPIAKRYPKQNWISVEPGYVVSGSEPGTDYNKLCIEYQPANAGVQ